MGTSLQVDKCNNLKLEALPQKTREAFLVCRKIPLFKKNGWYLAGGTALALHAGHRQSVDLDFFTTQKNFKELEVERELLATGKWQTTYQETGTIYGVFMGAKMSLIAYPFFVPHKNKLTCGTIKILLPDDIAAMKIIAISQRGRKRDFFDLYWYCKNIEPLINVVLRAVNQYPGQSENIHHIVKSLVYFADAENDPDPKLFFSANWRQVKRFFSNEAKKLMEALLK